MLELNDDQTHEGLSFTLLLDATHWMVPCQKSPLNKKGYTFCKVNSKYIQKKGEEKKRHGYGYLEGTKFLLIMACQRTNLCREII